MSQHFAKARVLIWGKTYPELSVHHTETVCTGGCLEDGQPVRLYPVPFRYLTGEEMKYDLYDWIEVPVARNPRDTRPESLKILPEKIRVVGKATTAHHWEARHSTIFRDPSWHFGCVQELKAAQKAKRVSLGMVEVGSLDKVELVERSRLEGQKHATKLSNLQSRGDLFGAPTKRLEFVPFRVRLRWHCAGGTKCPGHSATVMDWGLLELARRDGMAKAKQRMEALADLKRHDLHLYIGNLFTRQQTFSCIGLWYPLRPAPKVQGELSLE